MSKLDKQQGIILLILLTLLLTALGSYLFLSQTPVTPPTNEPTSQFFDQPQTSQSSKTTTQPIAPAEITITEAGFVPSTLTIAQGQSVTWVNRDQTNHLILSQDLEFDSELLGHNDSFTFTFEKVGTFDYRDQLNRRKFHGTVIVK